jgi:hypothetical protein
MVDGHKDPDNLVSFDRGRRSREERRGRAAPAATAGGAEDLIAALAVIAALALAVALVSGWIAIGRVSLAMIGCCCAAAVIAKVVRTLRRPKAPVTRFPPRRE